MESLLFSTKISQDTGSDVVGGSLPQILLADFYREKLGYKVTLHDPFYNSRDLLDHQFHRVIEIVDDPDKYDRIANCLFYVGKTLLFNHIEVDFETARFIGKKIPIKQSCLSLTQAHTIINKEEGFAQKLLDIPYIYQYDFMFKLGYCPKFNFSGKPFITNRTVYGIHIRQSHWKNIAGKENCGLEDFYHQLAEKIKSRDPGYLIIYYGTFNSSIDDIFRKFNSINGNEYSESILERAFLLSNVNWSFASINGFTHFGNYLALSKGKLKGINIVNDISHIRDCLHVRRLYGPGILEQNIGSKGGFFDTFKFYPKFSILKEFDSALVAGTLSHFSSPVSQEPIYLFFAANLLRETLFSSKLDNLLILRLIDDYKRRGLSVKLINVDKLEPSENYLYVLTHYSMPAGKSYLGSRGFDFNKPEFLNQYPEIGPDQLWYEDILKYFYRKRRKSVQPTKPIKRVAYLRASNNSKYVKRRSRFNSFLNQLISLAYNDNPIMRLGKEAVQRFSSCSTFFSTARSDSDTHYGLDQIDDFYDEAILSELSTEELYDKIRSILKDYDRVICEPSDTAFVFAALDDYGKTIFFNPHGSMIYLGNSIFADDPRYKLQDFFPIHFPNLNELKIHLINGNSQHKP